MTSQNSRNSRPHLQLSAAELIELAQNATTRDLVAEVIAEFTFRVRKNTGVAGKAAAGLLKHAKANLAKVTALLANFADDTGVADMPEDFDVDAVQANVETDVAVQTFAFIRDCKTLKEALEVVRAVREMKS